MSAIDVPLERAGAEPSVEQLRARLACEELLVTAHRWADEGRLAAVADLFVEDGVMEVAGRCLQGREAIRTVFAQRDRDTSRHTLHIVSNIEFRWAPPDRAYSRAVLSLHLLSRPESAGLVPAAIAVSDDEFARAADGRWRFAKRATTVIAGEA